MPDPLSQADELRTPEEKSQGAGPAPEVEAHNAALADVASGPAAPDELPDPLAEAVGDSALFGDPGQGVSSWPLTEARTDLPWDPTSPPPEGFSPEMTPQRYGSAAWDMSDPNIAAWVSWCGDQGLDPYDPDLLAWANWYYQEQLEGGAAPSDAAAAPEPDAVPDDPGQALQEAAAHEWPAAEDFAAALHAEGPGSFGAPAPDLSAVLAPAEDGEQMSVPPASMDDGAAGDLASFGALPADSASDLGIPAEDDLGPILEVGVDVFEIFEEEELAAPSEWVPRDSNLSESILSDPSSSELSSEPNPPEPIASQPIQSGSPAPEPIPPEPETPVLDAAAFGMDALDPSQQETALFDFQQAAASLAELEAVLQEDSATASVAHGAAPVEQGGYSAPESNLEPEAESEAAREPLPEDAPPAEPTPSSGDETTSSFLAEPEPPGPGSPGSGAEPAQVPGTHRVVVHTVEGEVKRGTVTDIVLEDRDVSLDLQEGGTQSLPLDHVRAIFFMLDEGESPPAAEGMQVQVTFRDGRQVAGFSPDYQPDSRGFFLIPASGRSRTARIWVYRAAVRQITVA